MSNPRVTVFIPAYNYASYLPEAIESVLEQDFEDFELLIADDSSSDDSAEVCCLYARKDDRIRFVRHEKNKGMVENWNWCMQQARGEYLKPMLADDRFNGPHALRRLVEELDANPNASLAVSSRLLIDEKGQVLGIEGPLGMKDQVFAREKLIRKILIRFINLIGEPSAVLFRKAQVGRAFDCSYRQLVDLEMWLYLLEQGNLAYIAEPLCCFRKHPEQQTLVNQAENLGAIEFVRLLKRYVGELDKRDVFDRIYQLGKTSNPPYEELADELRTKLSDRECTRFLMQYKLARPFLNLCSSFRKRRDRAGFKRMLNTIYRGS